MLGCIVKGKNVVFMHLGSTRNLNDWFELFCSCAAESFRDEKRQMTRWPDALNASICNSLKKFQPSLQLVTKNKR